MNKGALHRIQQLATPTAYASFGFVLRSAQNKAIGLSPNPYYLFFARRKGNPKETNILNLRKGKHLKTDKNRTEILNFRVTKEEKRLIEDKAYVKYDTLAPYLRDCALGKEILVIPGLSGIEDELNAIGNNLNQLTRAVNSGMCSAVDLTETRKEVAKVWQSLNSALQKYLLV